jgi:predicted dehydrogenase
VQSGRPPALDGRDGHRALLLAEAATESLKANRPVAV